MPLIVEDGTGKPDADALCSNAFADDYHTARGNADWSAIQDDAQDAAIRKATDYLQQQYGDAWKGERQYREQALDWPRYGARVDRYEVGYDDVPKDVQKAVASLALRATTGELLADVSQQVKRERVEGVVEVEYQDNSTTTVSYKEIDGMLRKYLRGGAGSVPIVLG